MKGTGAKRNVCPGSCVSTGAKFPVAPVESAPMGGTVPHFIKWGVRVPLVLPKITPMTVCMYIQLSMNLTVHKSSYRKSDTA